jgi:hypothetical protein
MQVFGLVAQLVEQPRTLSGLVRGSSLNLATVWVGSSVGRAVPF